MNFQRTGDKIAVIGENGEKLGEIPLQDVRELCGCQSKNRGFPKRVRILWVDFKNPNKVSYSARILLLIYIGLL